MSDGLILGFRGLSLVEGLNGRCENTGDVSRGFCQAE